MQDGQGTMMWYHDVVLIGRARCVGLQAVLDLEYNEAAVIMKAETHLQKDEFESARRVLTEALREHGRSQKLREVYAKASRLYKIARNPDYYKILGVSRDVDDTTLKKTFKLLALQCVPAANCKCLPERCKSSAHLYVTD
jgi:hypothetical protein